MPILPEHKELLMAQSQSKTLPEWVAFFDNQYSKNMIYSYCYRNGCKIKKISKEAKSKIQSENARQYSVNQDYFNTWSAEMAYVLGFWFADGCIYRNQMFDITTHTTDKYILNRIKEQLQYAGPLYKYKDRDAYRLNFSCVEIYKSIVALGGTEHKSLTVEFPYVPKEYLRDFIRGYFDGDGNAQEVKGNRIHTRFCSGSEIFVRQLLQLLHQETSIEGGAIHKYHSCWILEFGKKDSIKLGHYMYDDLNNELFLLRKRNKIEKYYN